MTQNKTSPKKQVRVYNDDATLLEQMISGKDKLRTIGDVVHRILGFYNKYNKK